MNIARMVLVLASVVAVVHAAQGQDLGQSVPWQQARLVSSRRVGGDARSIVAPPSAQGGDEAPDSAAGRRRSGKHLFGSWHGLRSWLQDRGITPEASNIWFPAYNMNGGTASKLRWDDQFTTGVTLDMDKLAGVDGGKFKIELVRRGGPSLNTDASLGLVQTPQAIYGEGRIWRLTNLWWLQKVGRAEIKFGRMTMHEDFNSPACEFESQYFCGTVSGHMGGPFVNGPRSAWGGRVRVSDRNGYTQLGIYEDNPLNTPSGELNHRGFYLGIKGALGVIFAVERAFTVRLGGDPALAGTYKAGAFYDTAWSNDLVRDIDGGYASLSHLPPKKRRGRYGFYLQGQQQFTAPGQDGRGAIAGFFTLAQGDPQTTRTLNIEIAGASYSGPLAIRPQDSIALGLGRARVNPRLTALQSVEARTAANPLQPQRSEYIAELDYTINVLPGLAIHPNVMYYMDPGGRSKTSNIVILGCSVYTTF